MKYFNDDRLKREHNSNRTEIEINKIDVVVLSTISDPKI